MAGAGPHPWLELALTEEEEAELKGRIGWKLAFPEASWLSQDDIRRLVPRVTPKARSAVYIERQAQVDSYLLTLAFATAAQAHGAVGRQAEATGVVSRGGRITGLTTSAGELSGDAVVFAMGCWSNALESWVGASVPIRPHRGQTMQLEVPGSPLQCLVHHGSYYVAPKVSGSVIAGGVNGFMGYDTTIHQESVALITKGVDDLCPGLGDSRVVKHVAGLRPATDDMLPILDSLPGLEGPT